MRISTPCAAASLSTGGPLTSHLESQPRNMRPPDFRRYGSFPILGCFRRTSVTLLPEALESENEAQIRQISCHITDDALALEFVFCIFPEFAGRLTGQISPIRTLAVETRGEKTKQTSSDFVVYWDTWARAGAGFCRAA